MTPKFINPINRAALPFRHEGSPLRHVRDGDSISRQWQKSNKDAQTLKSTNDALANLQQRVHAMKKRVYQQIPWHPFQIYQVPPNAAATPNAAWRTFRVRNGFIQDRPIYADGGGANTSITVTSPPYCVLGDVFRGTDGQSIYPDDKVDSLCHGSRSDDILPYPTSNRVAASMQAINVPNNGTAVTSPLVSNVSTPAEFVLPEGVDADGQRTAWFWIQKDEDTSPYGQLDIQAYWAVFCAFGSASLPYPNPNIIPIGFVAVRRAADSGSLTDAYEIGTSITQLAYDHQLSRYGIGYWNTDESNLPGPRVGSAMIYRGNWDSNAYDITNQTFYPGDVVSRTETDNGNTIEHLYIFDDAPTNTPAAPGASNQWKALIKSVFV